MLDIEWKKKPTETGTPKHNGYVGTYIAFVVYYSMFSNKNDNRSFQLTCNLHGIKTELGMFESVEKAKEKADAVCKHWVSNLGLDDDKS